MKLHIRCWGLLLLLLAAALPGYAQGMIIVDRIMPPPGVILPPPPPRPAPLEPLQLTIQTVDLKVRDFAATVTVEQTFRNQHGGRVEGTFLFPLPAEAAVTDFAMTVNGELVGAELLDADKARNVYEDIVRSQRDPGLLEYIDRTSFRARIFPIEAGETKRVKLEYSQALTADDGLARFVLPLKASAWQQGMWHRPVPMPRPFPLPTERDALRPSIVGPAPEGEPDWTPGRLTITAEIAAEAGIKSVYSPTHELDIQREGDHLVRVSYESSGTPPSSDFLLYYQLADADFGLSLVPYRGASDDVGTFLMLIAPKSEFRETQLQAKDIIFVADVSGSMSGQKIVQMRRALTFCLEQLNPTDRFGVIAFSSDVSAFEDGLVEATDANRAAAIEFVAGLEARGGTNIGGALETALADLPTNRDPARPAMVVFLTDGQPTVGETRVARLLEGVEQQNGAEARLFVFGVGDDVNTELLDRLSADNHGTRTYVRPGEDLEVPVSSFYGKIAYPVLSDLKLKVEGVRVEELQPTRLPDLA
ncbi:MAG TPA: hypothetical protein DCZ72_16090 [Armatimonadetes bacterium]|nr:hypothetical protein [Armatimonadota bacterium]